MLRGENLGANPHAIESRFDVGGKLGFQAFKIKIRMKIGENCALWLQFSDPAQSFGQREMTGVRRVAQGPCDPKIEAL